MKHDEKPSHPTKYREEAVHGSPGFPMVVYHNDFTTYVANQVPWHWHEELEFCVVTAGRVHFSLTGAELRLQKGEGIFINANTLHHMVPEGEEKAYMFSVLIHPGLLGSDKGYLLSSKYVRPYVEDSAKSYYVLREKEPKEQELLSLLQTIYRTHEEQPFAKEYRLRNLVGELWYQLLQVVWEQEPVMGATRDVDQERLYQALQYIQENYPQNISLDDICHAIAVGRSECCRLFKRNLQMSPIAYLITYRIHKAAAKLEQSNDTITQIATEHGFLDDSYFCKTFKRYMQVTPLAYRKQKTKEKRTEQHDQSNLI